VSASIGATESDVTEVLRHMKGDNHAGGASSSSSSDSIMPSSNQMQLKMTMGSESSPSAEDNLHQKDAHLHDAMDYSQLSRQQIISIQILLCFDNEILEQHLRSHDVDASLMGNARDAGPPSGMSPSSSGGSGGVAHYSTSHINSAIDNSQTVQFLKSQWHSYPEAMVNKSNFVHIMNRMLSENSHRLLTAPTLSEKEKLSALIEMFEEIDYNDDKKVSFEEFINFLINSAKTKRFGTNWYKKYKFKKVMQSSSSEESVKKICYFPKWDRIVTCGRTKKCKVINPAKDYRTEHVLPDHEGTILNAEYIDDHDLLVTSSADLCVRFWSLNEQTRHFDLKYYKTCNRTGSQTVLKYSSHYNTLFTGSRTGHLNYWRYSEVKSDSSSFEKDPLKATAVSDKQHMFIAHESNSDRIHDNVITDMLVLHHDNKLVTCSQDSLIKIHDLEKLSDGKSYKVNLNSCKKLEGHKKGVFSLAWNSAYHFLVSAGFEHEALVWVSHIRATPFRLRDQRRPHQHSLVEVQAVPNSPQVITADNKGMIKIWDIRTFQCLQTLYTENVSNSKHEFHNFTLNSFVYLDEPYNHIVTSGRKICIYEYERTMHPNNADDQTIVYAAYNPHTLSFLTTSGKDIKVWDALNGRINRVFQNLCKSEITAVALDDTGRKIFVGTHGGDVQGFTFSDGQLIKSFPIKRKGRRGFSQSPQQYSTTQKISHTSSYRQRENTLEKSAIQKREVTSLTYCAEQKLLIATTWEGGVFILGDRDASEGTLVKSFATTDLVKYHEADVKCSDFSVAFDLGVTGDDASKLIVWDLVNYSKLGECVTPPQKTLNQIMRGGITCVKFLGTFPCFVCADTSGFLHLWTVKPYLYPYHKVCSWRNYNTSTKVTPSITCMEFHVENNYLYTGDEKGYICAWDLEPIFEQAHLHPKRSKKTRIRKHEKFEKPNFQNDSVPRQMFWKAHNDSIKSLQIIYDPSCLLTASFTAECIIWNSDGSKMDSLKQAYGDWNFPIQQDKQLKVEESNVAATMNEIKLKVSFLKLWKERSVNVEPSTKSPFITQGAGTSEEEQAKKEQHKDDDDNSADDE